MNVKGMFIGWFMIAKVFYKTVGIFRNIVDRVAPTIQSKRVRPWFASNGENTHRLEYELNENSIVFDLGGYHGDWASAIYNRYGCYVHIFEPVNEYALLIKEKFSKNSRIKIYEFGLSNKEQKCTIGMCNDGSSLFKAGRGKVDIELKSIDAFMRDHNILFVDLMKINIEGGEYDLLDRILESKLNDQIRNIQVQFHDFVPNAVERMKRIQTELSKTHYLTYQYEFVWENWTKKKCKYINTLLSI